MMLDIRIRFNGARVRLRGFGMRKLHNLKVLLEGIKSIRERLARGIGENDAPTKPLNKGYARRKVRKGKRAIRDLNFTGDLLPGIKPRYADDNQAIADATGRKGRMKARMYRRLLQFSPADQAKMSRLAEQLHRENVTQTFQQLTPRGFRGPSRQPVGFGAGGSQSSSSRETFQRDSGARRVA